MTTTEHDRFKTKLDGLSVSVISDGASVVIHAGALGFRMTPAEAERFALSFVAACWQAGRNEARGE